MLLIKTGTVTIQRINGQTQQLQPVLTDVYANPQPVKDGAAVSPPWAAMGDPDLGGAMFASYNLFVDASGGATDETTGAPYRPAPGDLITFTSFVGDTALNAVYRQVADTGVQSNVFGLGYVILPSVRLQPVDA